MKMKGFTLIELMIVIAIVGIVISVVSGNFINSDRSTCLGGYMFVQDYRGHNVQVLDDQGHGIKCGVQR